MSEAPVRESEFNTVLQFRAYTNRSGYERLDEVLRMHQKLYNAALRHRRGAWSNARRSVTYHEQCKELTEIRREQPEWSAQHRRLATGTLRRAELAFQSFFRRVRQGQTPGYPRFKPLQRFRTLETHGVDPAMLRLSEDGRRAVVRVKGLPDLEIRLKREQRELPAASSLTTLTITRAGRRVTVTLGFKVQKTPLPDAGQAIGLDMRMGMARVVTSDGEYWEGRNPDDRRLKCQKRRVSRARKGSGSRRKKVQRLNNTHRRMRVSDRNAVHRFTRRVVNQHQIIAVERLDIKRMTATARGTKDAPGTLVQLTAVRNRLVLLQTLGKIRQQLAYKAARAGRRLVEVDPANTSRTCSRCGAVAGSPRVAPVFRCGDCGLRGSTAHNAAVNILRRGLTALGEGGTSENPSLHAPPDVASIRALARMRVEVLMRPTVSH